MRMLLNKGWSFAKDEPDHFRPVRLPHDWLIGNHPDQWYQPGVGWYRTQLPAGLAAKGRRAFLRFDGVYMDSTLYVNGQEAGGWKYGFTAFEHEITGFLNPDGEDELLLKVSCRFPSARWYTGAGVFRDVHLIIKNPCHFVSGGIYITTQLRDGRWEYTVSAETQTGGQPCQLRHRLLESGDIVPWSPEHPRLYTLRSELILSGRVQDTQDTRFGFRQPDFSPESGFSINGGRMKLNGVCLHQEFSVLGAAVHPDMIRRQFLSLKRMGVNAVRTAHNPPSSVFMDLADETGMLVVSEFTDVWALGKTANDYSQFFEDWHGRDVASWIRRDRNRPSVILWSLGNEIPDTHADAEKGGRILEKLIALVRRHDPDGHALPTLGSNYMAWENTQRCAGQLAAVGYNYAEYLYAKHHEEHPDWVMYGSETCSTVQSRGVYHFPLSQPTLSDDDLQCSSLGNSTTSWGARSVEACIRDDRDAPYSLGQFVWSGQDYLGEPTPYHTKNSYFGMLDSAGFEKDAFFLFQAVWTDPKAAPMVHLFPYWDFSLGQLIDVRVCTNQPEAALYLDKECLGRRRMGGDIAQNWRIPYRPGTLRAEAYDEQGKMTAQAARATFGEAEQLHLCIEHFSELSFATVTALDSEGRTVENANRLVRVKVQGGELLGLDNGDAADSTPYQEDTRGMFSGRLLAVIRRDPQQLLQVSAEFVQETVPVRKIELTRDGFHVRAKILPENATFRDLHWRLTNAAGVDSNLGRLLMDEDGQGATLIPGGDGEATLRCGVKNGQKHTALYAQTTIKLSGFGAPSLDPFGFVSAGLYSHSNVRLTNGNERGIATLRDGESQVCFDGLAFGERSSDELSVWLFPLTQEPFRFEVWEGRPGGDGEKLCEPLYDLGMKWNVYQELRVRLPRPMSGKTGLCLVFRLKTHVKGFQFHPSPRTYRQMDAASCGTLYGEGAVREGGAVLHIGNNTTLVYEELHFDGPGADRMEITWRSKNRGNPVQAVFWTEGGEARALLTLPEVAETTRSVFPLGQTVRGRGSVSLVFLPGCSLDLKSIRFIKAGEAQDNG